MTFIIWPKFIMISEKIDRKFLFRLVSKAITISEKDSCVFFLLDSSPRHKCNTVY